MAQRISIPPLAENNLVRNNCFRQQMLFYRYSGSGSAEVMPGPPVFCRISTGSLFHAFDIDNQEHAAPESVFPWNGKFVFKFLARGKGKLRAGIRWRLSYYRGDTDLTERSISCDLEADFKEYTLEGVVDDPHTSVNDRIFFEVTEGFADLTAISLYYPAPAPGVTFDKPHIAVLPGEEFTFNCKGAEKLLVCCGHSSNEFEPQIMANQGSFTMPLRVTGAEGMRIVGVGSAENCRASLFISQLPPFLAKKMRRCRFSSKPKHLLFFGDSLTAYDAGRNYTDIAGAFLPDSWSYTNAGIGGDDLPRLAKRLQNKPHTYRQEDFQNIWEKTPDEIFLFYGANDTKSPWREEYKKPSTSIEEQKKYLEEIFQVFKEKAPHAAVNIIASAPGYFPYPLERGARLRSKGIQHNLFGIPEHVKRYNRVEKKFALDKGWGYLDFHKVCSSYYDPKLLFIPDDGVHLTLNGHQLLAAALLEYLHKKEGFAEL